MKIRTSPDGNWQLLDYLRPVWPEPQATWVAEGTIDPHYQLETIHVVELRWRHHDHWPSTLNVHDGYQWAREMEYAPVTQIVVDWPHMFNGVPVV